MTYDRFDARGAPRDERSRWSDDRYVSRDWRDEIRSRGDRDERGFFDRAGDEIASWFGDDEADRRRREDRMRDERDYGRGWRSEPWSSRDERFRDRGRDYRPLTGDYGRSERDSEYFLAASGVGRSRAPWGRHDDPHYSSWRDRHLSELDRDYDEYRRENQSRFESEFGSWRERRQQKRGLLGQIREHMEIVGNDDQHVGTVDKVSGDRVILTKSDPESGGVHHSLSCSDVDHVEGDRVVLECSADQARNRWRDESRGRALFEREDQGEMGPRMLDRSFEGTYR